MLRPGWYVLVYHDVSWECCALSQGLEAVVAPDILRSHLAALEGAGRLLSVDEGLDMCRTDRRFEEPCFSLWFDDGYAGVRRFALDLCEAHGIRAAVSICSRFVLRQELFWRSKLAALQTMDGLRHVRTRLRRHGLRVDGPLRSWTVENCAPVVLDVIDAVFDELAPDVFREDAFRLFEDEAGLQRLLDAGWLIVNHSAAHYPLRAGDGRLGAAEQFSECADLVRELGGSDAFRVVPFGLAASGCPSAWCEDTMVVLGSRRNTADNVRDGIVYRYPVDPTRRRFGRLPIDARSSP